MAEFTTPGCDLALCDKQIGLGTDRSCQKGVSDLVKSLVGRVARRAVNHLVSGWTVVSSHCLIPAGNELRSFWTPRKLMTQAH